MSNPLIVAVERIKGINDLRARKRYAEALAASLRCDTSGSNPPQLMNADEIEREFKISNDDQDHYCIVLRRSEIRDFTHSCGRSLKYAEVTRRFKAEAYRTFFDKPIPKLAGKTEQSATVYTYAEVLHGAEIGTSIDPPEEVKLLFKELDIDFS